LGSANVLSGIALICGPRPGPTFRADHTVMETDDHRLSSGATGVASENGLLWLVPSVPAQPTNIRNRHNLAIGAGIDEGSQSTRKLSCPEIKRLSVRREDRQGVGGESPPR